MKLEFSPQIFEKKKKEAKISSFIKIRPVGVKLLNTDRRTDGQTHMTKLIVAFRNFANAPKSDSKPDMLDSLLGIAGRSFSPSCHIPHSDKTTWPSTSRYFARCPPAQHNTKTTTHKGVSSTAFLKTKRADIAVLNLRILSSDIFAIPWQNRVCHVETFCNPGRVSEKIFQTSKGLQIY